MAAPRDWKTLNWGREHTGSATAIPIRKIGKLSSSDAIAYVEQRINPKLVDAHRHPMEREWVKNIAFLRGNQHFVDTGNGFRAPVVQPHRVLYRANMVRTLVTKAVATVLSNSATFRAPAVDWTKKSRDRAFTSEKLFEHFRENVVDWPLLLEDTLNWAACCGSGFIEFGWDPDAGSPDRFYLDENDKPVWGLTGDQKRLFEEQGRFEDVPPGDIMARVNSPFRQQWDWSARNDFNDPNCKWGGTKELVDLEALEDVYGFEKVKGIRPQEPSSNSLWYDEMLAFMQGGGGAVTMPNYVTPRDKTRQRTVLSRYFEVPLRSNHYEGRFIVVAGNVVLVNGKNPYAKTRYPLPFVKIDWQRNPGSFIGHPLMDDLRNPQFQYNNARGRQTEVANVHSSPTIFMNKHAGLAEGTLAIEPGVVYTVDFRAAGGKDNIMVLGPVPQVPKELAESATRALSELQMIASQADPDQSKLPGQIRGAPALSMMIEEKNKALLPAAKSALRATVLAGRIMLSIAKHNYTSQRVIRYVGEDNSYRVLEFEAADIQTDIRVVGEPEYFRSKASDKAQIVEYVQAGILDPLTNPEHEIMVLKTLAFGNAEQALAERLADEENQDREWDEMTADPLKHLKQAPTGGMMLDYGVQPYDDDDTHIRVMLRRMKTAEFRDLDPFAKQLLVQHLQLHQERKQQALMQQMMLEQARPSGPAPRGQPSRPKPNQGSPTSGNRQPAGQPG